MNYALIVYCSTSGGGRVYYGPFDSRKQAIAFGTKLKEKWPIQVGSFQAELLEPPSLYE